MYRYEELAGSWPTLITRLDARDVMAKWSRHEPLLWVAGSVGELPNLTAQSAAPADREAVLDALVRLGAVAGVGDPDAALVVLHLLTPGALRVSARLARPLSIRHIDLARRMPEFVVGELMMQIRSFPVHRRGHRCAARLLWATHDAVKHEIALLAGIETPVEPFVLHGYADRSQSGETTTGDIDVWELLAWAQQRGVLDAADASLLKDLAESQDTDGPGARIRLAAAHGINERTVRRRRDRALAALRSVRIAYLEAA